MQLRIAGTADDSVVDGEGYRFTIFTQGCPHHCPGCHNPKTWDEGGGRLADTGELLARMAANPLLSGVTFSGGEPFLQPAPLTEIARAAHAQGRSVWAYTGWTLEELRKRQDAAIDALLQEVDVLVDGPYLEAERDLTLRFRGSRNQRLIDMAKTRAAGRAVLWG